MRRADFVFCIGFEGSTAIVDGRLARRHGNESIRALAEAGLFKQALCAALFDGDRAAAEAVLAAFNGRAVRPLASVEELERLYGVTSVPQGVTRITVV